MVRVYNLDEWRVWEQNASPIFLVMTLNSGMKELRDYFGSGLWTTIIIFEENQGRWLFRPKELKLLGQKMIDFLLCPPYRVAFFTGYFNSEQALLKKVHEIQFSVDLEALTNEELVSLFEDLCRIYYNWYKYGWFCEPIQFQSQDLLTALIDKEIKGGRLQFDPEEIRKVLFTIEEDTFAIEILRHLCDCAKALGRALRHESLASKIKETIGDADFAKKASRITLQVIESDGSNEDFRILKEKIKEHSLKYYWKRNNYYSTRFITEKDVLEEIFGSERFDISNPAGPFEAELENIKKSKEQSLSKKSALVEMFPSYYRNLVALVSSVGGSLLDRRKKVIMTVNGAFDKILDIIAARTNTDISDCRLLIPQELRDFVSSPEEYRHRFNERKKCFVVFQGDFPLIEELFGDVASIAAKSELNFKTFLMSEPFIAEGDETDKLLERLNYRLNFLAQASIPSIEKLEGITVYYDPSEPEMIGIVRVIKDPKVETLKGGEILVAPSTTPDYMDAIRKCKAIVTDWGGQTSHAAIVSRELRKPCIIGTNYGSQVLRNEDEIRIDFRQGIIEILKGRTRR
jgi:phosphohistidine swiveling domain-containing protein